MVVVALLVVGRGVVVVVVVAFRVVGAGAAVVVSTGGKYSLLGVGNGISGSGYSYSA